MKQTTLSALIISSLLFAQGCAVVGGIFKAGVWVGVLAVVLIIGIIIFIISKASQK
jgi:hypothetical protein